MRTLIFLCVPLLAAASAPKDQTLGRVPAALVDLYDAAEPAGQQDAARHDHQGRRQGDGQALGGDGQELGLVHGAVLGRRGARL